MINKKLIWCGMFFLFGILLISSVSADSYARSNPKYTQSGFGYGGGFGFTGGEYVFDREMCQAGQDFILQIAPLGCEPSVVRSDLLEEQNVNVFCPIMATKINPLIDIEAIDWITFQKRELSGDVVDIGFHPARSALGFREELESYQLLDNIGYVVVTLKRQPNASAMPEYVEGNLTAKIRYDIENAFGVGKAEFYLKPLNDAEWDEEYLRYSFWKGRGFLRAEDVYEDRATISVYSGNKIVRGKHSYQQKIATINLEEGQTSRQVYLPTFDYCMGGLQVRLDDVKVPAVTARLKINADVIEVAQGERFLEGRCRIIGELKKAGINQIVKISCKEDEPSRPFELKIIPKINLSIEGLGVKEYETGDWLYTEDVEEGKQAKSVYLGYAATKGDSTDEEDLVVYFLAMPKHNEDGLSEQEISNFKNYMERYKDFNKRYTGASVTDFVLNMGKIFGAGGELIYRAVIDGEGFKPISYLHTEDFFGKKITVLGLTGPHDIDFSDNKDYKDAMKDVDSLIQSFPDVEEIPKISDTYGERALSEKINLARATGQRRIMVELCEEFMEMYPDANASLIPEDCFNDLEISNSEISTRAVVIDNEVKEISFQGIYEPALEDYNANILVTYPDGSTKPLERFGKDDVFYLGGGGSVQLRVGGTQDRILKTAASLIGKPFFKGKVPGENTCTRYEVIKDYDCRDDLPERPGCGISCFDSVLHVYKTAGLGTSTDCVYGDIPDTEYIIDGKTITTKDGGTFNCPSYPETACKRSNKPGANNYLSSYDEKLNLIRPGDILSTTVLTPIQPHNVIFINWTDRNNNKAKVFEWRGSKIGCAGEKTRFFRYIEMDLSENKHPVYHIMRSSVVSEAEVEVERAGGEWIKLISLEDDSAQIQINIESAKGFGTAFISDTLTLNLNELVPKGNYGFTLKEVNLKKVAKVSVIPKINYAETNASFKFKIGIEKRGIELAPDKAKKLIEKLDESIEKWEDISEGLGTTVETLKAACFSAEIVLTAKNLVQNFKGKGIARQEVMRGEGGWYDICRDKIEGSKKSLDSCLLDNADAIEGDVNVMYEILNAQNEDIKSIQADHVTGEKKFLGEDLIDTSGFIQEYSEQVQKVLDEDIVGDADSENKINFEKMKTSLSHDGWKNGNYDVDELKKIELYTKILSKNVSKELKAMSEKRLYSVLYDVQKNSENYAEKETFAGNLKIAPAYVGFLKVDKDVKQKIYHGLINSDIGNIINEYGPEQPVEVLQTSDGKKYILVLDDTSGTDVLPIMKIDDEKLEIYNEKGEWVEVEEGSIFHKIYFKKYDKDSYENEFKGSSIEPRWPVVRYYETEPYQGLPAIVPFDLHDGWYIAAKNTLPLGGNIRSYDVSGRVNSFYLCNVGENGIEEFFSGVGVGTGVLGGGITGASITGFYGGDVEKEEAEVVETTIPRELEPAIRDDICQMINLQERRTYAQFYGLEKAEISKLVSMAVDAIYDASIAYKSGVRTVNIRGVNKKGFERRINVKVGPPAIEIPDIQCQDFMSPKDCNLIFNLCDPVICPSSRCDFGGNYPVRDVIQSGIIGSIALCMPNFKGFGGDVYMPVCLTGLQAGVDAWISVKKSYRDCLQTSLDTGETVGICDEMHSIYLCDFFWRQALPLGKILGSKVVSLVEGAARGGGEYLSVRHAWESAGKSMDYFIKDYGINSYNAFKARSTEQVGTEVCKNFISIGVPEGESLFDALTEPDSPSQFHGRFDEILFTTTTVPPVSHYKVFYHIYAGNDRGAYYRVYLREGPGGSFYQDIPGLRIVDSGYIPMGEYATETVDFTAPSGYKEMCIMVNGYEECGFKEVSTSFAVDYVQESYLSQQSLQKDIKTESECISGSASLYNLLTPNLQASAEGAINPELYGRGIIRICATNNPGKGTDVFIGGESQRWIEVGYCGNENVKCWLDQNSVKESIEFANIENRTLGELNKYYLNRTYEEGNYVVLDNELAKINGIDDVRKRISKITETIDNVFYNSEKAKLFFMRGKIYSELAVLAYEKIWAGEGEGITCASMGLMDCCGDNTCCESSQSECDEHCLPCGSIVADGDGEVSEEEEEGLPEDKTILFEFQDGGINLYYIYDDEAEQWQWSKGRPGPYDPLHYVNESEILERIVSDDDDADFIKSLRGMNYPEGLAFLMHRTHMNKGADLVAENVEMNHEGIFTIKNIEDIGEIYFFFEKDKKMWYYTFYEKDLDSKIGVLVPKIAPKRSVGNLKYAWETVTGQPVTYDEDEIPESIQDLIEALDDKKLPEGAERIFREAVIDIFPEQVELARGTAETFYISRNYVDSYSENFKEFFEEYSEDYLPKEFTSTEFKALLVAISQVESGVGTEDSGGDLLMGIKKQEGAERQIIIASKILGAALDGELSGGVPDYSKCYQVISKDDKTKCILSMYKTKMKPSFINFIGKNYADKVMSWADSWKEYFEEEE